MAKFEVPNPDVETNRDWTIFATQLADDLASDASGTEISISPRYPSDSTVKQVMLIRSTFHGTVVCASSGLDSPPAPWQASESGDAYVLEDDEAWVDRFAAVLVTQIRRTWNIPHPSFLTRTGSASDDAVHAMTSNACTPTVHSDESELAASVESAVRSLVDADVKTSDDGSYFITMGAVTAYVYIASSEEVRVHAPIVDHIAGRTRAAEVIADLNRRHPRLKFLLVEDRVHVALSVDAHPFVRQHAVNAINRIVTFVSSVDDSFARNLGGVVAFAHHVSPGQADAADHAQEPDDDVPPQLMALLEIDARSGGGLSAEDIVSVCGPDRIKISRYEKFCSEQAESWRDYAREAETLGEPETAAEYEAEAVPWDRIVGALSTALRTVGFFDNA